MNSVSVTGKNWVLRKFDQEKILYLIINTKNEFSISYWKKLDFKKIRPGKIDLFKRKFFIG